MFKRKKFLYFSAVVILLTAAHSLFFWYYYQYLNLHLSGLTVWFIFLFSLNFTLIFHLLKQRIFRGAYLLASIIFFLYFLVNFAYYEVFRNFWQFSGQQLGELNSSQLKLLSTYYNLVPLGLYISVASLFVISIVALIFYARRRTSIYRKIVRSIDFLQGKKNVKPTAIWLVLLFVIVVNLMAGASLSYYKKNINGAAFQKSQYYADLGVYGFLLDRLIETIGYIPQAWTPAELQTDSSDILNIQADIDKLALLSSVDSVAPSRPSGLNRPHVIIYQMESVDAWALKQEPSPMPFLDKLRAENIRVGHFFSNSCITINAELSANCSFYPEATGPVSDLFAYNNYYCLPEILQKDYGYSTAVYHANDASFWNRNVLAPRWGFGQLFFTPTYKSRASDVVVINDVIDRIKTSSQPTYNYIIGFTSHGPHNQHMIEVNHYDNGLDIIPYPYILNDDSRSVVADEESVRNYLGFLTAVDDDIKNLFDRLATEGLLDKTIVIIYGDHRYYPFSSGKVEQDFLNYNEIPFAMYVPGGHQGQVQEIASQLDIAPTLLDLIASSSASNMPPYFLGHSLFSANHPNSALSKCLGENEYIDSNVIIKNNKLVGNFAPVVFRQEHADLKYDAYVKLLADILERSDRILANNEIGFDGSSIDTSTSSTSIYRSIDFNQITDFDHDGLSDLREKTMGLDRKNPDTDGDGYLDGVEIINGYDPKGPGKLEKN